MLSFFSSQDTHYGKKIFVKYSLGITHVLQRRKKEVKRG